MNNSLDKLHPISIFFFGTAIIAVVVGLLNGFQYKVLHIIVVVGNVICGLLWQWKHEIDKKE